MNIKDLTVDNSVFISKGEASGKTLAVFCGVHGNEKSGVYAVQKAINEIDVIKGTVIYVFANIKAIKEDKRYIEKNLNRSFLRSLKGDSYEEKRARDLMDILDKSDALLDLHSSNSPNTTPFIITEKEAFPIVRDFNLEIVVTGFDELEPGATDGYMQNHGKVGICVECGYSGDRGEKNTNLAYDCILKFLDYYGAIDADTAHFDDPHNSKVDNQKFLHVDTVQKVTSKDFELTRNFDDFETLPPNTLIATQGDKEFRTKKERVILFGSKGKPIGAEAYLLGTWR